MASASAAGFLCLRRCGDWNRNRDGCGRQITAKDSPRNLTPFLSRAPEFRQLSLGRVKLLLAACAQSPSQPPPSNPVRLGKRLYVSGLSFRTTEESLRSAFEKFGELVEVNLVMDRIARRPRGFAFLRYFSEEESRKAIEGMHGKFLHGRVIFVEVAKPRSAIRQERAQNP